ncbi:MAG: GtrA family protein [Candidatus Magasanikbacteria bacterium]|nr:GtrA family protein [Candidatus Magasanikbacteria bacterium]
MWCKIKSFILTSKRQLFFYAVIGGSAFVLDMGSLILFKEVLHVKPVITVIFSQIIIINYVFFLNKHFSFQSSGKTRKQIVKFYLLAGWNYVFGIGWMWLLNETLNWNYLVVRVAGIILAVSWNFLLYKFWVYKN